MAYQTDVSIIVAVLFISCFWYWYQYQFGPVFRPFFCSPDVDTYPVQEIDSTTVCKIIIALRLLNPLMPTVAICLTRSGTGCFIAQPIWQHCASKS